MIDGTYAIHNMQTGQYIPTPLGECKPSEVDLREHEEIVVWDSSAKNGEGDWVEPDPEPTERERRDIQIALHAQAIIELTGVEGD